jgi:hypothetical protein
LSTSQQPSGQVVGEQGRLSRQVPVWVLQNWFGPHVVQLTPPSPQAAFVLPDRHVPLASQQPVGHVCGPQVGRPWHWPLALQVWPGKQLPQVPPLPQPSGPHCRPVQFGAQHSPPALHWLADP